MLDSHTLLNEGRPLYEPLAWNGTALFEGLEEAFLSLGLSLSQWVNSLPTSQNPWTVDPWMPEQAEDSRFSLPSNFLPQLVPQLLKEWQAYVSGVPQANSQMHIVWDSPANGHRNQSIIRLHRRKFIPKAALPRCVVLDASADRALWSKALGTPVREGKVGTIDMPFPPSMRIVQPRDVHLGKSTLEKFDGDNSVTVNPQQRDLLKAEVKARKDLGQAKKLGIITFQELVHDAVEALKELGYIYSDEIEETEIVTAYYYNLRGANYFTKCDLLVLVGYPRPNEQGLYEEACALFADDPLPISMEHALYEERMVLRNGNSLPLPAPTRGYKDSRLQALLLQKSRAELYQALHRARPFAPATSVREVLLLTDLPVQGVPVDTFFGRDGRMLDLLSQLLKDGEVTVPQLVDAYLSNRNPEVEVVKKDSLRTWVMGKRANGSNACWLAEATGTEYIPGTVKGQPGTFRTRSFS